MPACDQPQGKCYKCVEKTCPSISMTKAIKKGNIHYITKG